MLIPAYGIMWMGGRWVRDNAQESFAGAAKFASAVLLAALASEIISSGSFYFLGGRFVDPSIAGFLPRLMLYSPQVIAWTMAYVAIAALAQSLIVSMTKRRNPIALGV